jgi:lysophospholipase L1-like esterase
MKRVYVVGDSISIQYGPHLRDLLQGAMTYSRKEGEEEARLNLDNPQGANGGDSSRVLSFLRARAAAGGIPADILLLNCGLHDIKTDPATGRKQVPLADYERNLRAILELRPRLVPAMAWIRTTPADERVHNARPNMTFHRFAADVDAYNAAADAVMAAAGVPVIDLFSFTRNLGPDLFCDHVHFTEPVRRLQATFLAGWLACWAERA